MTPGVQSPTLEDCTWQTKHAWATRPTSSLKASRMPWILNSRLWPNTGSVSRAAMAQIAHPVSIHAAWQGLPPCRLRPLKRLLRLFLLKTVNCLRKLFHSLENIIKAAGKMDGALIRSTALHVFKGAANVAGGCSHLASRVLCVGRFSVFHGAFLPEHCGIARQAGGPVAPLANLCRKLWPFSIQSQDMVVRGGV